MNRFLQIIAAGLFLLLGADALAAPSTPTPASDSQDPRAQFEQANQLYERQQFAQAAEAYQQLTQSGRATAALYFNFGNALIKSGQLGRAIINFRLAERLAPRDPDIKSNLRYARSLATGARVDLPQWERFLRSITVNESTAVFVLAYWVWMGLLCAKISKPGLIQSTWTRLAAALVLLSGLLLALTWTSHFKRGTAVVIVKDAPVRYGPLEESQSSHSLPDGTELTLLDQKDQWLQVRDSSGRVGWVRRADLGLVQPPKTS